MIIFYVNMKTLIFEKHLKINFGKLQFHNLKMNKLRRRFSENKNA
jgi:hypothetical protein